MAEFTEKSTLRQVVDTPVGHDIATTLVGGLGMSHDLLEKKILSRLTLGSLPKLTGGKIDSTLVGAIINLLNNVEPMQPVRTEGDYLPAWWKDMVLYQIYPRSFCDSDGDGIGDLRGITSKLDYLASLGVNAIWMSPICDSPNDDNGYDIRDYRKIMTEFGTMEDFDELLREAHSRGIRVIMDMVLNHSSDEHEWFQKALAGDEKYKNYYYFRDGTPDCPPNNWLSFFSGSSWTYYPEVGQWALHSFSKKQMDLNWNNPELRAELYDILNFWLDKGVDGFRLDVINLIGKEENLPDGSQLISDVLGCRGIEHYFFGKNLHVFLREMNEKCLAGRDAFTVGECPGTGLRMNQMLTADFRKELDTVLCFDHLDQPGKTKFDDYRYDLRHMKRVLTEQQLEYSKSCWNILFFENHDNPRMISKVDPDPQYRDVLGKLFAVVSMTLCGTPLIYQGQELGMVNAHFDREELRDVESVNLYAELTQKMTPEQTMARINAGTRDHARVTMQWNAGRNAGFSDGEPWIKTGEISEKYNAESETSDSDSIFSAYRELIALRAGSDALRYGEFIPAKRDSDSTFCYYREKGSEKYFVEINLTAKPQRRRESTKGFSHVFGSLGAPVNVLRPFEANVYRCGE